jgi:ribosomal-protein-alanine N-acetyltransferase
MPAAVALPMRTILETARLRLREMHLGDLDFLAEMLADAEVMRYYPSCCNREEAAQWLQRQLDRYARFGHGLWLAEERASGEPRGQVGLTRQTVEDRLRVDCGWLIHRPYWRQGLATEAALACRQFAFDVLGLDDLISLIRPENIPSQGVARKLGMRPVQRVLHAGLDHDVYLVPRPGRMDRPSGGASNTGSPS